MSNEAQDTGKPGLDQQVKVKWDTSQLKSSYCNFCNANSTREEVVLNFGVNQTWAASPANSRCNSCTASSSAPTRPSGCTNCWAVSSVNTRPDTAC